jgi:hypothetical protein
VFESRPLGEGRSEFGEHAVARRELDEGLTALRQSLIVASEPTPSGDPGNATLNDPSSGQGTKARWKKLVPIHFLSLGHEQSAFGHGEGANWLHGPVQVLFEPRDEGASVMTISPDQLDLGEHIFQRREQAFASFQIRPIGREHFDGQQIALAVNEQVPFASPYFFSPYRSPFRGRARHWF